MCGGKAIAVDLFSDTLPLRRLPNPMQSASICCPRFFEFAEKESKNCVTVVIFVREVVAPHSGNHSFLRRGFRYANRRPT
jgi:hypothetical protein